MERMLFPNNPGPSVRNIEVGFMVVQVCSGYLLRDNLPCLPKKIKSHDSRILQKTFLSEVVFILKPGFAGSI